MTTKTLLVYNSVNKCVTIVTGHHDYRYIYNHARKFYVMMSI